ncbi:hypothetical protein LguiB_023647 [Lonicera macranthoides]
MGRRACCEKKGIKKGPWTPEEDDILIQYINNNSGLLRCGKSCRLRWTNYLRPDIKRGHFTPQEEKLVIQLHAILGNRWTAIASQIPGRTDNEIKNLWNIHLKKRLLSMGIDPLTHETITTGSVQRPLASPTTRHMAQWESARLEAEARLSRESLLLPPPTAHTPTSTDYFLRIWNSEVGESFRKVNNENKDASSSTKCTMDRWDSSSSSELEDSSDAALDLLLDFPENNDMGFLEENVGNNSTNPSSILTESSLNGSL